MTTLLVSSAPTVMSRLSAIFTAALDGTYGFESKTPAITYGLPTFSFTQDHVIIGDITEGRADFPTMKASRKRLEETYLLNLHFVSIRTGDDAQTAVEASFTKYAIFTDAVQDDPAIGTGVQTLRSEGVEDIRLSVTKEESLRGWIAHLTAETRWRNRTY